jgi:hypothetical protein
MPTGGPAASQGERHAKRERDREALRPAAGEARLPGDLQAVERSHSERDQRIQVAGKEAARAHVPDRTSARAGAPSLSRAS